MYGTNSMLKLYPFDFKVLLLTLTVDRASEIVMHVHSSGIFCHSYKGGASVSHWSCHANSSTMLLQLFVLLFFFTQAQCHMSYFSQRTDLSTEYQCPFSNDTYISNAVRIRQRHISKTCCAYML